MKWCFCTYGPTLSKQLAKGKGNSEHMRCRAPSARWSRRRPHGEGKAAAPHPTCAMAKMQFDAANYRKGASAYRAWKCLSVVLGFECMLSFGLVRVVVKQCFSNDLYFRRP
jgi:hypothetical protein